MGYPLGTFTPTLNLTPEALKALNTMLFALSPQSLPTFLSRAIDYATSRMLQDADVDDVGKIDVVRQMLWATLSRLFLQLSGRCAGKNFASCVLFWAWGWPSKPRALVSSLETLRALKPYRPEPDKGFESPCICQPG